MKGCDLMMNYRKKTLAGIAALAMLFTTAFGCSEYKDSSDKTESASLTEEEASETETEASSSEAKTRSSSKAEASNVSYSPKEGGVIDTTDLFSKRDLEQEADLSEASSIEAADGKTIDITEAGVYVISGSAKNCTIRVEAAKEDKVQLVLDGVTITNEDSPEIYVVSADKCFIMGGASVYRAALMDMDTLYITHVHTTIPEADAFFPVIDEAFFEKVSVSETHVDEATGFAYEFVVYRKRQA